MAATKCTGCGQIKGKLPICVVCKHEVPKEEHPGWITLRFFGFIGLLTVMLYGQATNFDHTEITVILAVAGFLGPAMFAGKVVDMVRKAVN